MIWAALSLSLSTKPSHRQGQAGPTLLPHALEKDCTILDWLESL